MAKAKITDSDDDALPPRSDKTYGRLLRAWEKLLRQADLRYGTDEQVSAVQRAEAAGAAVIQYIREWGTGKSARI
jgi:hypothetical protein